MSEVIKEQFKVVESDYFTDATTKGERQYPIDALYDSKKPDSQDHLVIHNIVIKHQEQMIYGLMMNLQL